jgi:hypothetical protein
MYFEKYLYSLKIINELLMCPSIICLLQNGTKNLLHCVSKKIDFILGICVYFTISYFCLIRQKLFRIFNISFVLNL